MFFLFDVIKDKIVQNTKEKKCIETVKIPNKNDIVLKN